MKFTRRFLLSSVGLAALCHALPAVAWFHGSAAVQFNGNPNVTISAINTSGGIACSRSLSPSTAGTTPCFIQVSAKNITATGTTQPYEDLSFSWNFGDTNSAETFTQPVTGGSVNSNNGQIGPEAAHVYRSAGTYTVTLTIIGQNGAGYTTATVTSQVIVGAFTAATTYYCDSTSAGTNSGTQANPFTSMASLNTALGTATTPIQVFLAQGSNFGGASGTANGLVIPNGKSNIHVTSYVGTGGAGANPIITVNSSNAAVNFGNPLNTGSRDDTVFSNLTLTNATGFSGSFLAGIIYGGTAVSFTNVYLDNCSLLDTVAPNGFTNYDVTSNSTTVTQSGFGVWNCTISSPQSGGLNAHGIFYGGTSWFFVVGGSISGGSNPGSANVLLHHIYPNCFTNSLYLWINFGAGGTGTSQRSYCINTNWDNSNSGGDQSGTLQTTQYYNISQCMMTGTLLAHDLGNSINNINTVQYSNVVCQGNALANLSSAAAKLQFNNAVSYTFRDNNIWNSTPLYGPNGVCLTLLSHRLYRNKLYTSIGESGDAIGLFQQIYSGVATTAASNQLTKGSMFFPVNTKVTVSASTDANIPNGDYFVVARGFVSGSTFFVSLSTTKGGVAIIAAATGTLTMLGHIANTTTITDNKIQDQRSGTSVATMSVPAADASGALIDRNGYYAPNQTGWNATSTLLFHDDASGAYVQKTHTQWQADGFDTNGTLPLSGFGWANPASGQF